MLLVVDRQAIWVMMKQLACPGRPVGRALELCGRFNILDMNNEEAGVWGRGSKGFFIGRELLHE